MLFALRGRRNGVRAVGYTRVSTREQGDSGAGIEAQKRAIRLEAERKGWDLVHIYSDVASGKSTNGRQGRAQAVQHVEDGDADVLIAAKLDRLSRSVVDFGQLLDRAARRGWSLSVLDLNVDTSDPMGEAMAGMVAVFAQLERKRIGQRTREALAVKRAEGVRLGRPRSLPEPVRRRIVRMRMRGTSYAKIADRLNADGVPTAHGGAAWYPATIRRVAMAA